jgi:hypothetical protein
MVYITGHTFTNRLTNSVTAKVYASLPPANVAPSVNAGTNQIVLLPGPVNLYGSAADDGQPNPPGNLTVTWTEVAGPGLATFANMNAPMTTATFSTGGTYVLRLTADDGQVQTSIDTTVIVVEPPAISFQLSAGALQLYWPTGTANWILQAQTNSLTHGLGTNWNTFPGIVTNPFVAPIDPEAGSVFYRLRLGN